MTLLTSIHGASTKGIIDWFNGAVISKQRLGGRRIGFCKRLRVDGGEVAEIMREGSGYGWFLEGRRRSLAAIGEEEKTLAEKTTLFGFSKEDDARWV
ncbi:hypothetical protein L3X38_026255 [Prunus dulcis]|uniref:Uncharacterized protein n=1 Tax=Prunus dulcis TaxID=3755 RepID=A0AAD4W5U6_PRUDU|nr:hypothetical protein L3X38_026255 [Prunus dulcis]